MKSNPVVLASFLALFVVGTAVGVRLVMLAARTRKLPELAFGLSLLVPLAGFGSLVVSALQNDRVPTRGAIEVGAFVVDVGFLASAVFVWSVFRRENRWAKVLVGGFLLAVLAMAAVHRMVPSNDTLPVVLVPRAIYRASVYAWGSVEALRYFGMMKRRLRLGLADPVIADRFRLWGLSMLSGALMLAALTAGSVAHVREWPTAAALQIIGALAGVPMSLLMFLSFFPPKAYVAAVERRFGEIGGET